MSATSLVSRIALAGLVSPGFAQARDLDLALTLGTGFTSRGNLYLEQNAPDGSGTFLQTRFNGPWNLAGVLASVEMARRGSMKLWVGAGFVANLGSPAYYQTGQATIQATSSNTQILNGSASYRRIQYGIGATWTTGNLGEYGAYLWRRNHRLGLEGTLNTIAIQGTALTPGMASTSIHSSSADGMLELSMAFLQAQPTFKTLERISLGLGFGPGSGTLGASDWQLTGQDAERLRPAMELRFAFGVRL